MKRFFKSICGILSAVLLSATCLSLAACEDIKTLAVGVSVYDITNKKQTETTIEVKLYRHLADDTVDAIIKYAEEGFYDGAVFYKFGSENTSQIMTGDYKFMNGAVVQNTADYIGPVVDKNGKPTAEFNAAGVVGSNLTNSKGSVGLWRSWYENGTYKSNNDECYNSGEATWFMPTSDISGFDGYFCVFGQIDLEDDTNKETFDLISSVLNNSSYYTSYTVYYTGEYGNLAYHCELTSDYEEDIKDEAFKDSVFEAEGEQFVKYNATEIKVPVATVGGIENFVTAKITSVKVK